MSHDTLVHRLVRRPVRWLSGTPVCPNHLTLLRFLTAVLAAALFTQGRPALLNIGAGVFAVSALLDRADGELARQTGRFSRHGHRIDLVADCSATVLAFLGLGWGASDGWLHWAAPLLGMLAGAGVTVLFWQINVRAAGTLPHYAMNGRVLVDPDDGMLVLPVLLWCFGPEVALVPAGLITPGLALGMALRRGGRTVPAAPPRLDPVGKQGQQAAARGVGEGLGRGLGEPGRGWRRR